MFSEVSNMTTSELSEALENACNAGKVLSGMTIFRNCVKQCENS